MRAARPIFTEAHRTVAPFADIARVGGPIVTLYMDTSPDIQLAPQMIEKRWKNARRELVEHGVPDEVIDAIGEHVDGAQLQGTALAVIASFDGVLHVDHRREPLAYELVTVASLPRLAPLLHWRQSVIPHVIVLADRTGADIKAWLGDGGTEMSVTVDANDVQAVTKVQPGGWSQPRYQRRVENAWEESAAEVADMLTHMADDVDARVIAVAGDVRAVELLCKGLPQRIQPLVQRVDGGRAEGSGDAPYRAARKLVATAAASDTVELLHKFREEVGQADRATDGVEATLAALARAQVETLLVHDDPTDEREAMYGTSPEQVGLDADTLAAMGVEDAGTGRLVDVAIRAALGTGAGVWIVPGAGGPTDGLGAVLRWS